MLDTDIWYAPFWFAPSVLAGYDWGHPWLLYLIPFVPLLLLLRWLMYFRFRPRLEIALTKQNIKSDASALLRFVPDVFMVLFASLLLLALARPQKTNEQVDQWTEGIDIMLVLDISESMQIEDFKPNRLEAAKAVASGFIGGRFQDRIGMAIFAGEAISYTPLTSDYDLLHSMIPDINFDLIDKGGTAIGNAIAVGITRLQESASKSKVMILLSDGDNTAGSIDPILAAEMARASGIKIYTIGVGQDGKVPYGTDLFGRPRFIENTLDETTLRKIAELGEGKFFRANNNQALQQIFERIDTYEKAEIKENRYKNTQDYYFPYLYWAACLLVGWLLLKNTFMSNALED